MISNLIYSHENLPPSIVKLPAFPTDDVIYNSCALGDQNWGHYTLPPPVKVTASWDFDENSNTMNILRAADQAGDFTLAHRDTWKVPRGYREAGGVAW